MRAAAVIAALFVDAEGCYAGLPDVDLWPVERDARLYNGPWPVVAHPDCKRWGRFWHGSTRRPHQYRLGDDGGCCAAAVAAVRRYGGVLEHPADSHAWQWFGLPRPARGAGWSAPDTCGGRSCYVEQGHYGHDSRKPTWLYAVRTDWPELRWDRLPQRLPAWMIERYGYAKARRIGVVAMIGGQAQDAHQKRHAAADARSPALARQKRDLITRGVRRGGEIYARCAF